MGKVILIIILPIVAAKIVVIVCGFVIINYKSTYGNVFDPPMDPVILLISAQFVFLLSFLILFTRNIFLARFALVIAASMIITECISVYHISNYNKIEIMKTAEGGIKQLMKNYYNHTNSLPKYTMDELQQNFQCCGCYSPQDWRGAPPESCNPKVEYENRYDTGCMDQVTDYMDNNKANLWSFDVFLIITHFFIGLFFVYHLRFRESDDAFTRIDVIQVIRRVVIRSSYENM